MKTVDTPRMNTLYKWHESPKCPVQIFITDPDKEAAESGLYRLQLFQKFPTRHPVN